MCAHVCRRSLSRTFASQTVGRAEQHCSTEPSNQCLDLHGPTVVTVSFKCPVTEELNFPFYLILFTIKMSLSPGCVHLQGDHFTVLI